MTSMLSWYCCRFLCKSKGILSYLGNLSVRRCENQYHSEFNILTGFLLMKVGPYLQLWCSRYKQNFLRDNYRACEAVTDLFLWSNSRQACRQGRLTSLTVSSGLSSSTMAWRCLCCLPEALAPSSTGAVWAGDVSSSWVPSLSSSSSSRTAPLTRAKLSLETEVSYF